MKRRVIVFILAGGKGERLYPPTGDRVKPAVPFGRIYGIIDFTLSNCLNSHLLKIFVLTRYKSISLDRHLRYGWAPLFNLYDREWPIRTYREQMPPAKSVHDAPGRKGLAINSLISNGDIISGGIVVIPKESGLFSPGR